MNREGGRGGGRGRGFQGGPSRGYQQQGGYRGDRGDPMVKIHDSFIDFYRNA